MQANWNKETLKKALTQVREHGKGFYTLEAIQALVESESIPAFVEATQESIKDAVERGDFENEFGTIPILAVLAVGILVGQEYEKLSAAEVG